MARACDEGRGSGPRERRVFPGKRSRGRVDPVRFSRSQAIWWNQSRAGVGARASFGLAGALRRHAAEATRTHATLFRRAAGHRNGGGHRRAQPAGRRLGTAIALVFERRERARRRHRVATSKAKPRRIGGRKRTLRSVRGARRHGLHAPPTQSIWRAQSARKLWLHGRGDGARPGGFPSGVAGHRGHRYRNGGPLSAREPMGRLPDHGLAPQPGPDGELRRAVGIRFALHGTLRKAREPGCRAGLRHRAGGRGDVGRRFPAQAVSRHGRAEGVRSLGACARLVAGRARGLRHLRRYGRLRVDRLGARHAAAVWTELRNRQRFRDVVDDGRRAGRTRDRARHLWGRWRIPPRLRAELAVFRRARLARRFGGEGRLPGHQGHARAPGDLSQHVSGRRRGSLRVLPIGIRIHHVRRQFDPPSRAV